MIYPLYRGLTGLAGPLILRYLARRLARGKEDAARLGERMGNPGLARPAGFLVWLHAASVGEALSLLPVIEALCARPGLKALVTTGTVTSARMMARRLPDGAMHQFVPVDRPAWVRRFLDHWRPDLALWAESEFWPNLLVESAARRIPMILVNGRISDRSFARWRQFPGFARKLLSGFVLCLGQTAEDGERLRALGAARVASAGNLKFAAPALPVEEPVLIDLAARLGTRPRWLAASTHAGEEALAGRVHRILAVRHPGLVSVIAPRHPERGPAIAAELAAAGLKIARRGAGETIGADTEIYLADTMGELGLFIRLAPLVLMGKSLLGEGGQNPLEPARLGASVLFGPNMGNFVDIAQRMQHSGAALQVADEQALIAALDTRLADPALMRAEGEKARAFAAGEDGVLAAVLGAIEPWLPK